LKGGDRRQAVVRQPAQGRRACDVENWDDSTRIREDRSVAREQERHSLRRERLGRRRGGPRFAREGPRVFLAGRTLAALDRMVELGHVEALSHEAVRRTLKNSLKPHLKRQ
jgi:hypothetical protein